jgi:hypothetical protein
VLCLRSGTQFPPVGGACKVLALCRWKFGHDNCRSCWTCSQRKRWSSSWACAAAAKACALCCQWPPRCTSCLPPPASDTSEHSNCPSILWRDELSIVQHPMQLTSVWPGALRIFTSMCYNNAGARSNCLGRSHYCTPMPRRFA